MKKIILFTLMFLTYNMVWSQLESEMLPEGIVFPRMDTAQRDALTAKTGQCIFNYDNQCIECVDGGGNWRSYRFNGIFDGDNDTFVTTEFVYDEDIIRMEVKGQKALWIRENTNGQLFFEPRDQNLNVFFGGGGNGLAFDNTATNNTIFGAASGFSLTTGNHNTAFGAGVLGLIDDGSYNIGIGSRPLQNSSNVHRNIAMGYEALMDVADNDNIGIGHQAMKNLTTSKENIAIGNYSLMNATSFSVGNIAIGHEALRMHPSSYSNIAIGYRAGKELNINSNSNTILGINALRQSTNASANIVVGTGMENSTTNIFTGQGPLNNVSIGYNTLENTVGSNSVAIGSNTLNRHETGSGNTAVGVEALIALVNGSRNTAIGFGTLFSNQGTKNTAIGHAAGQTNEGNFNVFVGNEAGAYATGDNKLHIANTSAKSLISGDFSTDEVTINSIVNLTPRNTPPPTPSTGTMYMDDGTNTGGTPTLRVYINATLGWKDL